MLRIHCLQQWYSLSDPAAEDALYEIASMRCFAQLSLERGIPHHTTIMNFRHLLERYELGRQIFEAVNIWLEEAGILLERYELGRQIFEAVNIWLEEAGILLKEGGAIDATIIDCPLFS